MAVSNYDTALAGVLAHEGGYSNDPRDPGGPTNYGITIADYRRYMKADATASDVRAMRPDQAKAIYRQHYWAALRCDELPAGLDYAVFDYGVNSGVARAIKVLQRLLGLPVGGPMSDVLVAAAGKADPADLVARLCDERLAFLKRLRTWPQFGVGWSRRVAEVRASAVAMAAEATAQAAPGRTNITPAKTAAWTGGAAAIAAAGLAAAHLAFQSIKEIEMSILLAVLAALVSGYVMSVFTWPRLRQAVLGLEAEIDDLRAKARALEATLRG